jgi:homoserine dehydrogenase
MSLSGCLSGTMNYVSQRINEDAPMSKAVREAMSPPRNYTEPDPRVDLAGEDFRRKLVILARLFGKKIGVRNIAVESLVPDEWRGIGLDEFLTRLPELDASVSAKVDVAKKRDMVLWFLGDMNLSEDKYRLGFHEIPLSDPMAQSRESDNVLKIQPRHWRRPVTLIGPGAGAAETVTGLISGLASVRNSI